MQAAKQVHLRLWEFRVRPGREQDFERIYGSEGDWAQLFRRSGAFLSTELYRDCETGGRYVTIDRLSSRTGFEAFLLTVRAEYDTLDRRCASLTEAERSLGTFVELSGSNT